MKNLKIIGRRPSIIFIFTFLFLIFSKSGMLIFQTASSSFSSSAISESIYSVVFLQPSGLFLR